MDSESKYIIIGSGHAGLSALEQIRIQDPEGNITLVSREDAMPYSPTILPYILSGQIEPDSVSLIDQSDLEERGVVFLRGKALTAVKPDAHQVILGSGETLRYEKLLLATGAKPATPPIPGLEKTPYHVLRTMDDVLHLRSAAEQKDSALILGAGLIGMHACESLVKSEMKVTVLEPMPQVLPGYFDEEGSGLIHQIFIDHGVKIILGREARRVSDSGGSFRVSLDSGDEVCADLLLVSTGIRPSMEYLADSGIEADQGILVDGGMKTSAEGVWAAGDVAQAACFFSSEKRLFGTLLNALDQGRIAGMGMVDDPSLEPYAGGMNMNTYKFFGHRAFSAGLIHASSPDETLEEERMALPDGRGYLKLFFRENRLVGVSSLNIDLDPGIMCELIRRRVDVGDVKEKLLARTQDIGRILMNKIWRQ